MKKNKENYFDKLKNDKKFKAKVELGIGFGFIFIALIYVNIVGVGSNYNYNYNNTSKESSDSGEYETDNEKNLYDKIVDNYEYNLLINIKEIRDIDSEDIVDSSITYKGKVYKDKETINKIIDNDTYSYYRDIDEYYSIKDNSKVSDSDIYDYFDYKYININDIKKFVSLGKLDHVTNYSNGNVFYVYNVLVSDIISDYKGNDIIEVEVCIKGDTLGINIDYTNLINKSNDLIKEVKVNIEYTNINLITGDILE